jgi:hypothetical protein
MLIREESPKLVLSITKNRKGKEKRIEAYQKCVNKIDDFLEYRYANYTKEEIRTAILSHIFKLNKDLTDIKND